MPIETAEIEKESLGTYGRAPRVIEAVLQLGKDYAGTSATEFGVLISQMLVYRLSAKYFGSTGFSEYAVARRTISVLYPLVLLGLGVGLPRYVAHTMGRNDQDSRKRYLGASVLCVELSAIFCVALMSTFPRTVAYLFFGSRDYTILIFPLSLVVAGLAQHAVLYGYFRGTLAMRNANLLQFANLGITPLVAFYIFNRSVRSFLEALGILTLAIAGVGLMFISWKEKARSDRKHVTELLRYGIQRVPGDFVHMALFALPATFVAHTNGIKSAGFVAFGISMLNLVGSFFSPFGLILLPRAATLLGSGKNGELKRHVWLLVKITLIVSAAIALAIAIFADQLIRLYLGPDFTEAAGIVRWLLLAAVPYSLYLVLRNVIDAFHELGVTTMILGGGFVVFCLGSATLFLFQDKLHIIALAFVGGVLTLWILCSGETLRILRVAAPAD